MTQKTQQLLEEAYQKARTLYGRFEASLEDAGSVREFMREHSQFYTWLDVDGHYTDDTGYIFKRLADTKLDFYTDVYKYNDELGNDETDMIYPPTTADKIRESLVKLVTTAYSELSEVGSKEKNVQEGVRRNDFLS